MRSTLGSDPEKPKTADGFGGYPLTDAVTAMWGAASEPPSETEKVLTFLIYFRGAAGWHEGKWQSNGSFSQEPAVVEFSKGPIVLHAQFSRKSGLLSLFRKDIPVSRANVVLVDHVDQPGKEVVSELGKVNLRVPSDANPAIYVVQHSREIETVLFGAAQK